MNHCLLSYKPCTRYINVHDFHQVKHFVLLLYKFKAQKMQKQPNGKWKKKKNSIGHSVHRTLNLQLALSHVHLQWTVIWFQNTNLTYTSKSYIIMKMCTKFQVNKTTIPKLLIWYRTDKQMDSCTDWKIWF